MRHILVPILSTADVAAVPELVKLLRLLKPLATVVMSNPSLGINDDSATAEIDKRIADLTAAKDMAKQRDDVRGWEGYLQQIEDAKTERITALRSGWKSMSKPQREEIYNEMFLNQFLGLAYVRSAPLPEDTTPDNFLDTLAKLRTSWPDCLPESQWSLVWPRSVAPITLPAAQPEPVSHVARVETAPTAKKAAPAPQLSPREAREKALKQFFTLKKAAIGHGIPWEGRASKEILDDVIAKEFPEAIAV